MRLATAVVCLVALAQQVLGDHGSRDQGHEHGHLVAGKYFDRIMVVIMENEEIEKVVGDPNFAAIANKGRLLTSYHGITHPSEPNYITMLGGDYFGVQDDAYHHGDFSNLVDLLEAKHVSWKSYNQKYVPGPGGSCNIVDLSLPADPATCQYKFKHNPFLFFDDIVNSNKRCRNIVGASQLATDTTGNTLLEDIKSNNLAQFVYYVPEQCNDGHGPLPTGETRTTIQYSGQWLIENFFGPNGYGTMLDGVDGSTLLVITYDEGTGLQTDNPPANTVYTVLIPYGQHHSGDRNLDDHHSYEHGAFSMMSIHGGEKCNAKYDHYSLLRTVEDNWSLGTLGRNDAKATAICTGPLSTCGGC